MALFIKFDGVDGQAKDKDHKNWSDCLSMTWGVHKAGTGATGQTRHRGVATVEDFVITKELDKASPKQAEGVLTGKVYPKVEIHDTATYGDGPRDIPQVRVEERAYHLVQPQRGWPRRCGADRSHDTEPRGDREDLRRVRREGRQEGQRRDDLEGRGRHRSGVGAAAALPGSRAKDKGGVGFSPPSPFVFKAGLSLPYVCTWNRKSRADALKRPTSSESR